MPIFDQGYQHWEGKRSGHAWRWLAIARRGVRSQTKSVWTRIALFLALSPAVGLGAFLAFWGLLEQRTSDFQGLFEFLQLPADVKIDPVAYRSSVWTLAFSLFLWTETFVAVIVVLVVGPNLISQDMRFNAMPLYLSRPLRRLDYFAGKLGTIGFFLAMVMIAPAILSFIVGLAFSLSFSVLADTYRVLLASLAFGAMVVLVFGLLMLAISSLSKNTRNVAAIWIGIWLMGFVLAPILTFPLALKWGPTVLFTNDVARMAEVMLGTNEAYAPIGIAYAKMIGIPLSSLPNPQPNWFTQTFPWLWAAYVLMGLVGLSVLILTTRVKSLDRLR